RQEHPASGRQSNQESDRSHAFDRSQRSRLFYTSRGDTLSYRAAEDRHHRRAAAVVVAAAVVEPTGPSDGIWEPVRMHRRVSCSTGASSTEPAYRHDESTVVRP